MWVFFIMNILLLHGLTCAKYICDTDPTEYCHKGNLTFELPNDINELNAMCREDVRYVDCLQSYETMCFDEYLIMYYTAGDSAIMYKLIKEICQYDSRLHTALADHVSCIKATIDSHADDCTLTSESKSDDYFAFLREELKNDRLDLETVFNDFFVYPACLEISYSSSCVLHKIENSCGTLASEVSIEIFQSSTILLQSCLYDDFPKIRNGFVDFLKHSRESEILQQILSSSEFIDLATELLVWEKSK